MGEFGDSQGEIEPFVEKELPSFPIGVVEFAGDRSAFIRKDDAGNVRCVFENSAQGPKNFDTLPIGRKLDLKNYTDTKIVQVPPGSIDITTYETIESNKDELYVRMRFTDASTEDVGIIGLDEKKMLKILTGESGGLAIFSGGAMSPEFALVMEQDDVESDDKSAVVTFLTTQGVDNQQIGINSIPGVYSFFKKINDEFNSYPTPLQRVVNKVLDKGVRKDKISETPARREILKSILMAHARLADEAGSPEHIEFINKYLPERKTIGRTSKGLDTELEVNEVLNTILIGKTLPTSENAEVGAAKEIEMVHEKSRAIDLKTEEAKRIYDFYVEQLGTNFGVRIEHNTSELVESLMNGYFTEIINFTKVAEDPEEFEDLSKMLNHLRGTSYAHSDERYATDAKSALGNLKRQLEWFNSETANLFQIQTKLIQYVDKKHGEALIKNHRLNSPFKK